MLKVHQNVGLFRHYVLEKRKLLKLCGLSIQHRSLDIDVGRGKQVAISQFDSDNSDLTELSPNFIKDASYRVAQAK